MKKLVALCIQRPVALTALCLALVLAAVIAVPGMSMSRLPPLTLPSVIVEAVMSGLPAKEMRELVALPLEDALSSVRGLKSLVSIIRDGSILIELQFEWGENILEVSGRVREVIDAVYPLLPEGAEKPRVLPAAGEDPLAVLSLTVHGGSLADARSLAVDELKPALQELSGVSQVLVTGGREREIIIMLDTEKALQRGLTIADVAKHFAGEHVNVPGGEIREGEKSLIVVARGRFSSLQEAGAMPIQTSDGIFRLKEIADIRLEDKEPESIFTIAGKETVGILVYRQTTADPVKTAHAIEEAVKKFRAAHSKAVMVETVSSTVNAITEGVTNITISAIVGAIAVLAVLFLLLQSMHTGFIAAAVIPAAVTASLIVLALLGRTLNTISLAGIALSVGMISDNAVIVLAALIQRQNVNKEKITIDTAAECTCNTIGSTFGSTITTVIVFLPVLFIPGVIGKLYSDLALGLSSALVTGWIFSFTLVPSFWYHKGGMIQKPHYRLEHWYGKLLKKTIRLPHYFLLVLIITTVLGTGMLVTRPASVLPHGKAHEAVIDIDFPRGTLLSSIADKADVIAQALKALLYKGKPVVGFITMKAGAEEIDMAARAQSSYRRERLIITVKLAGGTSFNTARSCIEQALNGLDLQGISIHVHEPEDRIEILLSGNSLPGYTVRADSPESALTLAQRFVKELGENSGAYITPLETARTLILKPVRERSALAGLATSELAVLCSMASAGTALGAMELEGKPIPIRMKSAPKSTGKNVTAVQRSTLFSGKESELSQEEFLAYPLMVDNSLFTVRMASTAVLEETSAVLIRKNRKDILSVEIPETQEKNIKKLIKNNAILERYHEIEQEAETARREFTRRVVLILALAVLLLYLVLASQFESFFVPLVILASIPLSIAGAGPALLAGGAGLDSGSILGLVVLFGTAVNNAIVLFEITRQKRLLGYNAVYAAFRGAIERIRSVAGTTLTTLIALIPLLFQYGSTQRSMALALLGGLFMSTVLTVFVYPLVFVRMKSSKLYINEATCQADEENECKACSGNLPQRKR